jgi:hypothetical protein
MTDLNDVLAEFVKSRPVPSYGVADSNGQDALGWIQPLPGVQRMQPSMSRQGD